MIMCEMHTAVKRKVCELHAAAAHECESHGDAEHAKMR